MAKDKKDPLSEAALAIARGDTKKVSKEEIMELSMSLGMRAGQIQAANMFSKYGDIARLVLLQEVKETKAYKLYGTWDKFCKLIGLSRRIVDEDLANLEVFGREFLATVAENGLSYRKLGALRQISHDGSVTIEDGVVLIAGEEIPITETEELEAAITRVVGDAEAEVQAKNSLLKSKDRHAAKLSKALDKHEAKAEQRGIPAEDAAFLDYLENLRTGFDGYVINCTVKDIMERVDGELSPLMRAGLLSTLRHMKMHGDALYGEAVDHFGEGLVDDGEKWSPGG